MRRHGPSRRASTVSSALTVRGKVAAVGLGETTYYKRGGSPDPEFVLVLKAILAACADAGIDPTEIDGYSSYSNDRNLPSRLHSALGAKELRFSNMQWGSVAKEHTTTEGAAT